MPSEDIKLLEFNKYKKSNKAPFIIYADLECLVKKIYGCKNNSENSYKTKVDERISCGFSMSRISSFKKIQNKYDVYKGKDCMKVLWIFRRPRNKDN